MIIYVSVTCIYIYSLYIHGTGTGWKEKYYEHIMLRVGRTSKHIIPSRSMAPAQLPSCPAAQLPHCPTPSIMAPGAQQFFLSIGKCPVHCPCTVLLGPPCFCSEKKVRNQKWKTQHWLHVEFSGAHHYHDYHWETDHAKGCLMTFLHDEPQVA